MTGMTQRNCDRRRKPSRMKKKISADTLRRLLSKVEEYSESHRASGFRIIC